VAPDQASLTENFLQYFAVELATTGELLREAYRLRYRVYCDEFKYEPADAFPDEAEHDEFDPHSLQCLIVHRPTGRTAGCARLVNVSSKRDMPLERFCMDSVYDEYRQIMSRDREKVCEFSRLAVDGVFRRRPSEDTDRFGAEHFLNATPNEKRTYPLIAVAALLSGFALADLIGRPHIFAMMEPFLPRLMKRSGILVETAGEPMEYHGTRAAYYSTAMGAVANLQPELKTLHEGVRMQLANSLGDTKMRAAARLGA
jgi:N-acyl amino acid synthase of PEP-CTERM/exosortase system